MKNKQFIILKIVCIIILVSVATATSLAIYKGNISGDISATSSKVIAEIENQSSNSAVINASNLSSEYNFKVKNYITENSITQLNQVDVNYYLKVTGLEELESSDMISLRLYYIDEENNYVELFKETSGNFTGYYNANKILGSTQNEENSYKLIIELLEQNPIEKNLNVKIDLGYTQYIKLLEDAKPNSPDLINGMIPVIWNGNDWVTVNSDSDEWYDYELKKWANVVMVAEENKSKYIGATTHTVVNKDEINAMYVWVPRYVYKINTNYYHKKVTVSEATEALVDIHFSKTQQKGGDFWDSSIEINNGTDADSANGKWTTNPAFTFENIELNGIWVAKFQVSNASNTVSSYVSQFYFKPARITVENISIDNMFKVCREMETKSIYGLEQLTGTLQDDGTFENDNNGYDIHLTKNSEWATIAFLSNSKYGQANNEIAINNYFTTGGSADYLTVFNENYNMSSTGNETGIYDLSGDKWEYVSAYLGDGTTAQTKMPRIYNALQKYKNVYHVSGTTYSSQLSIYNMFESYKCCAIWETSGTGVNTYDTWFEGKSNIGSNSNIALTRGTSGTGIDTATTKSSIYSFGYGDGTGADSRSFRAVLVVDAEL